MQPQLHVIILAAGKGKRMHSALPKVLHKIGGKPLLTHVIEASQALRPEVIHVVCRKEMNLHLHVNVAQSKKDNTCRGKAVRLPPPRVSSCATQRIKLVEQKEQLGTGHAVQQVLPCLPRHDGTAKVVLLYGDVPLITPETLRNLLQVTRKEGNAITLVTAKVSDPAGYGRIVRDRSSGQITAIVEERDASPEQRKIQEINSGILCVAVNILRKYLPLLKSQNRQGEYYLTDIIAMALADGQRVGNLLAENSEEILGVNDKQQLAQLERCYQVRTAKQLMRQGVTLLDPQRFDVRGDVSAAQDVIIDVNVVLEGRVKIGANAIIGPNCYIKDTTIGENAEIRANCVIEGAVIGDDCIVGPFARIRPQSKLAGGAHVGNFVEIKNSVIGEGSKANHLSYVGDTVIGKKVNVGAGTITCNYDGVNKYKTVIEDGVFIGSNAALVAPVRIKKNATIGAGSTVTSDAPAGKLTIARARQVTIKDWRRPVRDRN